MIEMPTTVLNQSPLFNIFQKMEGLLLGNPMNSRLVFLIGGNLIFENAKTFCSLSCKTLLNAFGNHSSFNLCFSGFLRNSFSKLATIRIECFNSKSSDMGIMAIITTKAEIAKLAPPDVAAQTAIALFTSRQLDDVKSNVEKTLLQVSTFV
jgi:hypothetical protein